MAGYSGTPLPQKLGIKPDHRVALLDAPPDFDATLGELPERIRVHRTADGRQAFDVIVCFVTRRSDLVRRFGPVAKRLDPAGGLWIAWPKKASKVASDVTEDTVREVALATGLVDNKVCAIDETWSGLRCVVRKKDRPAASKATPAQSATSMERDGSSPSTRAAFESALARSKKAKAAYDKMPPSHRKEWLSFIEEAKRPETRAKRIKDSVRRIGEGG